MKKVYAFLTFALLTLFPCTAEVMAVNGKSELEMYQEMVYAAVYPKINNAVVDFYSPYLATLPQLDTSSYEFNDIENIGNHTYVITIVVYPFVGAHQTIGKDSVVLELSPFDDVQVISYEHLESYDKDIKNSSPEFQTDKWFKKPLPQ